MTEGPTSPHGSDQRSVVHSSFAVLRVLGTVTGPVGVTELAKAVGLPKTTVHRILEQLEQERIVGRRAGKWLLGPGLGDLLRAQHQALDLVRVAQPRLQSLAQNTGAFVGLFAGTDNDLRSLYRWYGANVTGIMTTPEWRRAAEHPASAVRKALERGHMASEYGEAHPETNCIAHPFELPSGHLAVLGMAQPQGINPEQYKRSLERVGALILADVRRSENSRPLRHGPVALLRHEEDEAISGSPAVGAGISSHNRFNLIE